MKLLLILLSIATFTVKDKRSVDMTGTWPYDIGVNYYNTGSKGSVTGKDTATLSLSGLENTQIESVKLYLRSNQSTGAGVITMTADGEQIYRLEGTYKDWFGAYDNTTYQPIGWTGQKKLNAGTLVVEVAGTVNSLHIEKYEITWTQPISEAYSVTLMADGISQVLTERAPESGVVLPEGEDKDGWFFVGWSTTEVTGRTEDDPDYYYSGERYYPRKNSTLWALYTNVQMPTWEKVTTPKSGYYVLELNSLRLSGWVENRLIAMHDDLDHVFTSDLYYIDFVQDSCTIYHHLSEQYIGFNSSRDQLAAKPSYWEYRILPDSTWMFITKQVGEEVWILYPKNMDYNAWLSNYTLGGNPNQLWSLYAMPDPTQTRYWTSHPAAQACEKVNEERAKGEWIVPFGIYDLIIKDGKKELRLKE